MSCIGQWTPLTTLVSKSDGDGEGEGESEGEGNGNGDGDDDGDGEGNSDGAGDGDGCGVGSGEGEGSGAGDCMGVGGIRSQLRANELQNSVHLEGACTHLTSTTPFAKKTQ